MSQKDTRRKRHDGVYTLDDYKGRFRIDDITGCWHWAYSTYRGEPYIWVPALKRRTTLGVAVCVLTTGRAPEPGTYWHVTCGTPHCGNPKHRKPGTRSEQMLAAKLVRSPLFRAKVSVGRAYGSKLSDEDVEQIRSGTDLLREVAARYGISLQYASDIRLGKKRRATAVAPNSSVFAWRPAA